jgi:hypothetical protein
MTWGEFKRLVESRGVTDANGLRRIELDSNTASVDVWFDGAGGVHITTMDRDDD